MVIQNFLDMHELKWGAHCTAIFFLLYNRELPLPLKNKHVLSCFLQYVIFFTKFNPWLRRFGRVLGYQVDAGLRYYWVERAK